MKVNKSLSELFKGSWLVSVEGLYAYSPIVNAIITGRATQFEKPTASVFQLYDDSGRRLTRESYQRDMPEKMIGVVQLSGPVMKNGDWCSYGATDIAEALQFLDGLENCTGIVLRIDSPGGAVGALAPFMEYAKGKTKPVIALVDTCCSLGYWIALELADRVYVENTITSQVGSVGVMCSFVDTKPVLEKQGYKFHEIYADQSTEKNQAFKLALEGKYDQIKADVLNPLAVKFQELVREKRPNLKEELGVLTGKTFAGDKAIELGMVDGERTFSQVVEELLVMSEIKSL